MVTVLTTVFSSVVSQGIVYLHMDDICLKPKDWSPHLQKLETVLKTLDSSNLSCQLTKASSVAVGAVAPPPPRRLTKNFGVQKDTLSLNRCRYNNVCFTYST
jgi:hypothetical protein